MSCYIDGQSDKQSNWLGFLYCALLSYHNNNIRLYQYCWCCFLNTVVMFLSVQSANDILRHEVTRKNTEKMDYLMKINISVSSVWIWLHLQLLLLVCEDCEKFHHGDCPFHGPLLNSKFIFVYTLVINLTNVSTMEKDLVIMVISIHIFVYILVINLTNVSTVEKDFVVKVITKRIFIFI